MQFLIKSSDKQFDMLEVFLSRRAVHLLNAGGTMDMQGRIGRGGWGGVSRLVGLRPRRIDHFANIFARPMDSSAVGKEEWKIILRSIEEEIGRRGGARSIILTHGTDTMAETALVLTLEAWHRGWDVPIILTGSRLPADQADSDAPQNLDRSVLLGQQRSLPPGVYVVFEGKIYAGSRVRKIGRDGDFFETYGMPVGEITSAGKVKINFTLPRSPLPFPRETTADFGYVEHVVVDNSTPADVFRSALIRILRRQSLGLKTGLVLQGDFSSNPEFGQIFALIEFLTKQQVPIIVGSKKTKNCLSALNGATFIPKGLAYKKARTKLSWLLKFPIPYSEMGKWLTMDLWGEVVDLEQSPEFVAYETYPANDPKEGTEVVMAYPDLDAEVIEDTARRLLNSGGKRPRIVIVGFGNGTLPVGSAPFPELDDPRATKEALMASHPLLKAVGEAIDHGVSVRIIGETTLTPIDLSLYEVGRKLSAVGAV